MPGSRTELAKLARKYEDEAARITTVLDRASVYQVPLDDVLVGGGDSAVCTVSLQTVKHTVESVWQEWQQLASIKEQYRKKYSRCVVELPREQSALHGQLQRLKVEFQAAVEQHELNLIKQQYNTLYSRLNVKLPQEHHALRDELSRLYTEVETVTAQQQIRLQTVAEDAELCKAFVQERDRLRSCAKECWNTISWIDVHGGGI